MEKKKLHNRLIKMLEFAQSWFKFTYSCSLNSRILWEEIFFSLCLPACPLPPPVSYLSPFSQLSIRRFWTIIFQIPGHKKVRNRCLSRSSWRRDRRKIKIQISSPESRAPETKRKNYYRQRGKKAFPFVSMLGWIYPLYSLHFISSF